MRLSRGAILSAFDRDVTSKYYDANFKKELSEQTRRKKYRNYSEEELDVLAANTQKNSHNELWVNGEVVEIVGGYISKEGADAPGLQAFIRACDKEGIPIRRIE